MQPLSELFSIQDPVVLALLIAILLLTICVLVLFLRLRFGNRQDKIFEVVSDLITQMGRYITQEHDHQQEHESEVKTQQQLLAAQTTAILSLEDSQRRATAKLEANIDHVLVGIDTLKLELETLQSVVKSIKNLSDFK